MEDSRKDLDPLYCPQLKVPHPKGDDLDLFFYKPCSEIARHSQKIRDDR